MRLLSILMTICLPLVAWPSQVEIDGVYYKLSGTEAVVVSRPDGFYSGSITIPESINYNNETYSVTSISERAFMRNGSLTSISIPNSVTAIGAFAFENCTELISIAIPNSVVSIGRYAFHHTAWLNRQPCGLVYAGKVAYTYKGLLPENTLSIADGTKGIAGDAFSNCIGLTSIFIPNSVTTIGENAFERRVGLTSVTIPNSVTSIGKSAFSDCSGLTSVTIPCSVTSIGEWAFSDCNSLTSVTIPNSVTSIGHGAFHCKNLRKVVSLIEAPFAIKRNSSEFSGYPIFHSDTFNNATLYVPAGTIDKYKNTEGWQDFLSIEEIDAM